MPKKPAFYSEADGWRLDRSNILSESSLSAVKSALEQEPVIVEHKLYRRSSAPKRQVFDEYDDFVEYLDKEALPGDVILVWPFSQLCRADNAIVSGKFPDNAGRTPVRGAY